jgi:hypothetical protein
MPDLEKQTIKDEDGNERTVYDAEQVEAVVAEKETAFTTEKEELEAKVKEFEEQMSGDDKDKDFKELRKAKDEAEKKIQELETSFNKEITELKSAPVKQHRDQMLDTYAGKDEDFKKKMESVLTNELKNMPESTKEEVDAKLRSAFKLAADVGDDGRIDASIFSSAAPASTIKSTAIKDDVKDMGSKKFGLSEEDYKNAQDAGLI